MNVLIINAFGTSVKAKSKYKAFCNTIDSILKKVTFKSGIDNFYYTYRTVDDLDDFLYNLPSNQKKTETKKNEFKKHFDKLDFIFIDGNENSNLPWLRQGTKLLYLIQLCQTTGKSLYAGGIGMLHLIYHCATGGHYRNIINSNGDYPTIEDLNKIPIEYVDSLKKGEAFLDYATGDLYEFTSHKEWKPICNVGIHKLMYAEKFRERGKFVMKEYKLSRNCDLISTYKKEIKVNIVKQYCLHWLIKSIPVEFVANTTLTWYTHNYCVNSPKMQIKTICDSNFGAIVIEHENTIGCLYHINKHFPETVNILHNFISNKFILAQSKSAVIVEINRFGSAEADKLFRSVVKDISHSETEHSNTSLHKSQPKACLPHSNSHIVNHSRLYGKITKSKTEAPHCGFSYSTHDMIFVKNNAVLHKRIPLHSLHSPSDPSANPTLHDISTRILKNEYDNIKPDPNYDDEQLVTFYKKQEREICQKLETFTTGKYDTTVHKITKQSLHTQRTHNKTESTVSNIFRRNCRNRQSSLCNTSPCYMGTEGRNRKYRSESNENVLTMLFPYINEEDFKIREYEPGRSKKKKLEVVRVDLERKIKSNFNVKFRKYDRELNTFGDKPSIRCSSAYMTQEEARRKEFLESKKKWMCNEDFRKVFGKKTLAQKDREELRKEEEYNEERCEYKPIMSYAFRTMDKTKWVSKKNFIV